MFITALPAFLASPLLGALTKADSIEPDWPKARLFADVFGVGFSLLRSCWEAERGVLGREFGQDMVRRSIRKLHDKEDWQPAQACRTLVRASVGFRRANPGLEAHYAHLNPDAVDQRTDINFLWTYRTRFVDYLAYTGWAPQGDPPKWAENVMYWWEIYHKEES